MQLPALPTDYPQERLFSIKHLPLFQHTIFQKLGNSVLIFYENGVLLTDVCE